MAKKYIRIGNRIYIEVWPVGAPTPSLLLVSIVDEQDDTNE